MGQAVCRSASQESLRPQYERTGSARRASCANSRLAGDSTKGSWSWAKRTKPLNGCLAKSRLAPTRVAGAQDRSDERHDHVQPMSGRRPFPTTGSEAKEKGYALQMPAQGKGTL
jgi:hypothetical protein